VPGRLAGPRRESAVCPPPASQLRPRHRSPLSRALHRSRSGRARAGRSDSEVWRDVYQRVWPFYTRSESASSGGGLTTARILTQRVSIVTHPRGLPAGEWRIWPWHRTCQGAPVSRRPVVSTEDRLICDGTTGLFLRFPMSSAGDSYEDHTSVSRYRYRHSKFGLEPYCNEYGHTASDR